MYLERRKGRESWERREESPVGFFYGLSKQCLADNKCAKQKLGIYMCVLGEIIQKDVKSEESCEPRTQY